MSAASKASPFVAFRSYNFRLFWTAQLISQAGTWMQKIGQAWLVLQLTDSPVALGSVISLQGLPVLFGSMFASVWVDRLPKHRLIIVTQSLALVQATLLAYLTISGTVQLWHVYVLAFLLGNITAVDNPARLSLVMELVGRDKIVNAVGLNSAVENGARLVGPALAGLAIAAWGVGVCFAMNAASFLATVVALLLMRQHEFEALPEAPAVRRRVLTELHEGLRYVFRRADLVTAIIVLAGIGCFGYNYNSMVPLLAEKGLRLGPDGYGLLMSAVGLGALLGAFAVASMGEVSQRRMLLAALGMGTVEITLAFTPVFATAFVQLVGMAFCGMVFSTSCNSTLQLGTPNEMRGRVMGLYTQFMTGSTPIGALLTGLVTDAFGVRVTVFSWGSACALAAVAAAFYARTHRASAPALAPAPVVTSRS